MIRTPHPVAGRLRLPSAALFSVLALLAFASFPMLAQANPNYVPESSTLPPSGGGHPSTSTHANNPGGPESSPHAKQSNVAGEPGGNETGNSHHHSSKSQGGASGGNNPSSPGGGGEGQGKQGNGGTKGQNPPNGVQMGEQKSSPVSDSGGSSPLVPILIAVAVLAAISVGAVLVRQRRGSADGISLKRG